MSGALVMGLANSAHAQFSARAQFYEAPAYRAGTMFRDGPAISHPYNTPLYLLPREIVQLLSYQGLRSLSAPRRRGSVYIVDTADYGGQRLRAVLDMYSGDLVDLVPLDRSPFGRKSQIKASPKGRTAPKVLVAPKVKPAVLANPKEITAPKIKPMQTAKPMQKAKQAPLLKRHIQPKTVSASKANPGSGSGVSSDKPVKTAAPVLIRPATTSTAQKVLAPKTATTGGPARAFTADVDPQAAWPSRALKSPISSQ